MYALCYGRIRSYATFIADELHVLLYARYNGAFDMLNVDKMEHRGSSRSAKQGDRFQN